MQIIKELEKCINTKQVIVGISRRSIVIFLGESKVRIAMTWVKVMMIYWSAKMAIPLLLKNINNNK